MRLEHTGVHPPLSILAFEHSLSAKVHYLPLHRPARGTPPVRRKALKIMVTKTTQMSDLFGEKYCHIERERESVCVCECE